MVVSSTCGLSTRLFDLHGSTSVHIAQPMNSPPNGLSIQRTHHPTDCPPILWTDIVKTLIGAFLGICDRDLDFLSLNCPECNKGQFRDRNSRAIH